MPVGRRYVPLDICDSHAYVPQRCTLCGEVGGAIIRCSDCIREYHISCAWTNGHRFGFEMQPVSCSPLLRHSHPNTTVPSIQVRNHRRDGIAATFKGDTGNMVPIVCCQEHDASKHVLFDMCETDEIGEVISLNVFPVSLRHADLVLFAFFFILALASRFSVIPDRAPSVLSNVQTSAHFPSARSPPQIPSPLRCHPPAPPRRPRWRY